MGRLSKISKLPRTIREDLNQRLDRSDTARSITEWLNAIPAVQEMLKICFNSEPVSEQNITNWRRTGFASWQLRETFMERLEILHAESEDIESAAEKMTGHAARLLSIHFAMLLSPSSGLPSKRSDSGPKSPSSSSKSSSKAHPCPSESICGSPPSDLKSLCDLTRAVVSLRRSDFHAAHLKLLQENSASKSPAPASSTLTEQIAAIRSRRRVSDLPPLPDPDSETPSLAGSPTPSDSKKAPPHSHPSEPSPAPGIKINQDISSNPVAAEPSLPLREDFDLAAAYVAWMFKTQSLEIIRERYAGRERYLPWDVQAALKNAPSTRPPGPTFWGPE